MQEEKKWWKRFSAYQIIAFILTMLFVVGIIVTIAIMTNLKKKTDDTRKKNDEIEDILKDEQDVSPQNWQTEFEKQIIDFRI